MSQRHCVSLDIELLSGWWCLRVDQHTYYYLNTDEKDISSIVYHFVMVYLNDIVIYNNILEEHSDNLKKVFQDQRENKLYIK